MKSLKIGALILLCILVGQAYAVHLQTEAQYVTWNTDVKVTNNAEFAAAVAQRQDDVIRDAYNALASPAFWVWRTNVTKKELYENTSPDATTWSWTIFKAQTVQEQNSWFEMFATTGTINPSLSQVRTGVGAIFGAGNAQTAFLLSMGRRQATRLEKLLANTSGGNVGTTAAPALLTYEGSTTTNDVAHMLVPTTPLN